MIVARRGESTNDIMFVVKEVESKETFCEKLKRFQEPKTLFLNLQSFSCASKAFLELPKLF
jgi:hypothetical protein